jgi:BTB/POZ domain
VTCGPDRYKVHKVVLCGQSDFFKKACNGGFREASSGVIEMKEDDPAAVKAMLQFFYTFDYEYEKAPDSDVVLHAKVCHLFLSFTNMFDSL